ncbi:helix-turn-helix domain-containing protein [Desulfovibrio sp. OttesenSCG-928-G15]|nr:helix-turn-helix domain-containing protein [Desulfovibrio sp. OttesenSCG-928-G15]
MNEKKITAEALSFWLDKSNMTQGELAKRTSLAQNYISQIKTGRRFGSFEAMGAIADAFGVSLPSFLACEENTGPDTVFVERVSARPSAGSGSLETDVEHRGLYSFHRSFIQRKGGTPDDMKIFEVSGDSMEPTLGDGDLIMINLRETTIKTGHIYLVRIDDELYVKRLEPRPGVMLLKSDNTSYESISIDKNDESKNWEVFGRMVWSCREY